MMTGKARRAWTMFALTLVLASAGMLVGSSSAFAQAAVEQYIPSADPADNPAGGGGSGSDPASLGAQGGGIQNVKQDQAFGSASGGDLPLTDYPATPFVLIIVAILATGLLVRFVAPAIARRWPGTDSASTAGD